MLPFDPVDLSSPLPFGALSYYAHIGIGLLAWLSALVAILSRKGSPTHVWAGRVFMAASAVVVVTTMFLLATRFAPPLLLAAITAAYAISGGYLALQPDRPSFRRIQYALAALVALGIVFILSNAVPLVLRGDLPPFAPVLLLCVPVILLIGDLNYFRPSVDRQKLRVRRHLSRMAWALVVMVRAPLTEIYANLNLPVIAVLTVPLLIAPLLIAIYWRLSGEMGGVAS